MEINALNVARPSISKATPIFGKSNDVPSKEASPERNDEFKKEYEAKTEKQKKEIIYKSMTNASGWTIFGGALSTIYYWVRSDEKIAKKYDLDVEKDKEFVNQIRKKQILSTLPGVILGVGILSWVVIKLAAKPE